MTPKKKYEPVPFNMAEAKFTLDDGYIKGDFHPISLDLWRAIIGFHRQVSINLSGESVSYHKWSHKDQQYHTIIPWQKSAKHSLKVDVNWMDPRNQKILDAYGEKYGEDFLPACTIHTHVDAQAFESGIDSKDEVDNPGWHITLGKLVTHDKYHFDFRMRIPQIKKLKEHVHTGLKVNLTPNNLFGSYKKNENLIHTMQGTTDWHHLLERVEV